MTILTVSVSPHAKRDEVKKNSDTEFAVSTVAPAAEGKANKQVIKLLARYFNCSPSKLIVSKGERWNVKTVLLLD